MAEENVVYVGKKPPLSYVLAVVTLFNNGHNEVVLKARGKAISRAVDVEQIVKNRFLTNVVTKEIKTGTETITTPDGKTVNVSTIDIVLAKQ
ncbi:MAG: DNA-binding protein Alba [Euryarchaeota archaeon]|nr:DNA-binding protein Alba [Euryarchaeota archaeon]MCD6158596.1 DNA-binding protein Alba [Euryarchaeota archaeon]HHC19088.1 DNA-binding protein Alba [Euryarchaeota archaeon]